MSNFPEKSEYFGPGLWFAIHTLARLAIDDKSIEYFIMFMKDLEKSLPCSICRENHYKPYLKSNPLHKDLLKADYKGRKNFGVFYWTWNFHNAVNKRLRKKEISIEDAVKIYYVEVSDNISVCQSCGK